MDPAEIAPVMALKERRPAKVGDLRQMLGFLSYYRSFIPNFACKAKPLYNLAPPKSEPPDPKVSPVKQQWKTKKGHLPSRTPIQWTPEHQEVLNKLIEDLTKPPIIGYPDFEQPFALHCDASQDGFGAVLYQQQQGKVRVVAYGSRSLSQSEKRYHSGKLEFLALKWAICERFRDYLYHAQSFVVYTDNNPLTYVRITAKLNAAGHRWVSELADFCFTIRYRPGKNNNDTNGLSRMPLSIEDYMNSCTREVSGETVSAFMENVKVEKRDPCQGVGVIPTCALNLIRDCDSTTGQPLTPAQVRKAQEEDEVLSRVIWYKSRKHRPSRSEIKAEKSAVATLLKQWLNIDLDENGVLRRRTFRREPTMR